MATITGLTAERMLAIEAASVVDGDIVGDDLFLTRKDGTPLNAGNVRGPRGADGPMGRSLAVLTAQPVLDIGMINQIRAGRQLSAADFTNMGLSVPLGLWNLSSVADSSGNGRNLTNRGAVPFVSGINGAAASAAAFSGSTGQSLYIADAGAADPFRLKNGSWGCWFRTAKRGANQRLISKMAAPGSISDVLIDLYVTAANVLLGQTYTGAGVGATGISDVADDRWHFAVVTADGAKLVLYLDGNFESSAVMNGPIASATFGPLNIGSAGDTGAGGIATIQMFGRVDEAFVTTDVLSPEEVRNLYCASIPHSLGAVPATATLSVRRRRRGSPLAVANFPSQPVRLHNFVNGAFTDEGSGGVPLAVAGGGSFTSVTGPAGLGSNAYDMRGASNGLGSTDAGLPLGLNARTIGAWFKASAATETILSIGTLSTGDLRLRLPNGTIASNNVGDAMVGPYVADGLWHFVVEVNDNAAADGSKRKLYLDGRLVASSAVMTALTGIGALGLRVGAASNGTLPFIGQISRVFVYSGAMTAEQVRTLYNVGAQVLPPSPKDSSDHIETIEAARMLAIFDTIESSDSIDVAVLP